MAWSWSSNIAAAARNRSERWWRCASSAIFWRLSLMRCIITAWVRWRMNVAENGNSDQGDEGDEEVFAIQKNAKLMEYIGDCIERARKGPTKSLAEIKAELG